MLYRFAQLTRGCLRALDAGRLTGQARSHWLLANVGASDRTIGLELDGAGRIVVVG